MTYPTADLEDDPAYLAWCEEQEGYCLALFVTGGGRPVRGGLRPAEGPRRPPLRPQPVRRRPADVDGRRYVCRRPAAGWQPQANEASWGGPS